MPREISGQIKLGRATDWFHNGSPKRDCPYTMHTSYPAPYSPFRKKFRDPPTVRHSVDRGGGGTASRTAQRMSVPWVAAQVVYEEGREIRPIVANATSVLEASGVGEGGPTRPAWH